MARLNVDKTRILKKAFEILYILPFSLQEDIKM